MSFNPDLNGSKSYIFMENDKISLKNLLQHLLPAEILNEKLNLYYQI